MTDTKKTGLLSREILKMIALSALIAGLIFWILSTFTAAAVQSYVFDHDIHMSEFDWMDADRWIYGLSTLISVIIFGVLFLAQLREMIAYIQTITAGIDALGTEESAPELPLEGNNELTALARAVNDMASARQQLRDREQALAREKDQLIRAISHDIRTPLTSILSYSEFLSDREDLSPEDCRAYTELVTRKARQIRDLTDILLDGSRRSPEPFEDAALLMAQITEEFCEELEDRFRIDADLSGCKGPGTFDVQELRRIFDNLSSNIQKYADPAHPVLLTIRTEAGTCTIRQENTVLPQPPRSDSLGIGLNSIRRIAQHYAGQVTVEETPGRFAITVTLPAS